MDACKMDGSAWGLAGLGVGLLFNLCRRGQQARRAGSAVDADPRCSSAVAPVDGPASTRGPQAQDLEQLREGYVQPVAPFLHKPAKHSRAKRIHTGPVRRSSRHRGKFAAGTPVKRQQRELITRLQIAREGETIRDEALNAYLDLFRQPLPQKHIDVILSLFGWMPEALPLSEDVPVECLV